MATKNRAVLIFIHDNNILLLYRFKGGEEYYVFPGGGVEDNESIDEAAIREAEEEARRGFELLRRDLQEEMVFISKIKKKRA